MEQEAQLARQARGGSSREGGVVDRVVLLVVCPGRSIGELVYMLQEIKRRVVVVVVTIVVEVVVVVVVVVVVLVLVLVLVTVVVMAVVVGGSRCGESGSSGSRSGSRSGGRGGSGDGISVVGHGARARRVAARRGGAAERRLNTKRYRSASELT